MANYKCNRCGKTWANLKRKPSSCDGAGCKAPDGKFIVEVKIAALPKGCRGMPDNCGVRGLPKKLYRWQSSNPKGGIALPPGGQNGISTAVDGKVAFKMGATNVTHFCEIDTAKLASCQAARTAQGGFWEVVGSRNAGYEFKIWIPIPQAAITKTWGKGQVPNEHKPRNL